MIPLKLEEFIDSKSLDKLAELYEVMIEERLSVKETGINYRVINHWDEKGIIRFARSSKEGNRKFSFVDFVWIKIVNELRSFGVQLPVIQKIANEIYEPLPMKELMENFANHLDVLKDYEGEDKEEFAEFIRSGAYKDADFSAIGHQFTYLHILIAEAIATRNPTTLIVFNDGEWFPYMKQNEHLYPKELLYKKEYSSQVRVSITDLIFRYIFEDSLADYFDALHLFTSQESKLIDYIRGGNYKKVLVLFKSKKNAPLEIKKNKTTKDEITHILREKDYREFIITDKKNKEFRIRAGDTERKSKLTVVQ